MKIVLVFIRRNIEDLRMKKFLRNFDNFLDVPCESLDGSTIRQFMAQLEDDSAKVELSATIKSIDRLTGAIQHSSQDVRGNQNTPVIIPGVIHNLKVVNYKRREANSTASDDIISSAESDQEDNMTDFLQKMEVLDFLVEALAEENVSVEDLKCLSREQLKSFIVSGFQSRKDRGDYPISLRSMMTISLVFFLLS